MKKLLKSIRDKLFSGIYARLDILSESSLENIERLDILSENIANNQEKFYMEMNERIGMLTNMSNQNLAKIESMASLNNNRHNQLLLKFFNLFQLSNNLFFDNNNLSGHVYYNYISSLDIDKELNFFNEIPIERFCDELGTCHNVFTAGQLSNLLIKTLGYGRSARICAGGGIQEFEDGITLCPISLLPSVMGISEVFISTNPHLSFLLLNSKNILEEISDNVSEFILLPVEIPILPISMDWTFGFGDLEKDFDQNREWRWAIDFQIDAVITVINNMGKI